MKFQICSASLDVKSDRKLLATVEAASHPQAAALYWELPDDAVERTGGWGGQNGTFRQTSGDESVYVRMLVLRPKP